MMPVRTLAAFAVLNGLVLFQPSVVTAQSAAEVQELRARAEKGDAGAQYSLGFMYADGRGVPRDDAQAVAWYRKAAAQGHADAQLNLGGMYDNGQGVPQDDAQAMAWYRKAAEQGDADAQYNLGGMYANGQGVPQDYTEAHKWINLAASRVAGADQTKFAKTRDDLAKQMTPEQVADAQKRARAWQDAFEERKP